MSTADGTELTVLFAHGSRHEPANEHVRTLAATVAHRCGVRVQACFLEGAAPDLEALAANSVAQGVTAITILPVFVAPGTHTTADLPRLVDSVRQRYPDLSVRISPIVGITPVFVDALATLVSAAEHR